MKTLYFDCFAGASGNMILGALVALGVDKTKLIEQIKLLNIPNFEIEFTDVDKSGITSVHAEVKVPHEHVHRHLHNIEKIIDDSKLSDSIKKKAIQIFTNLAEAEAKIHGIEVKKVHFHEVGAMDAIIEVVGACIGFELLGIENSPVLNSRRERFCKNGARKFPFRHLLCRTLKRYSDLLTEIEGELCTPTGAAIISTLAILSAYRRSEHRENRIWRRHPGLSGFSNTPFNVGTSGSEETRAEIIS